MQGLSMKNLIIGYGKKQITKPIYLDLKYGKSYGLLGLNGSGKTTLLKTLLGIIPPISGNCLLNGENLFGFTEKNRAQFISYMPQRYSKGVGMTVKDIVLMGFNPYLSIFEGTGAKEDIIVNDTLALVGIDNLANNEFAKLSAGQQQLAILCRSLVQNTSIIIMDEPDSGLDFPHKHSVLQHSRDLAHNDCKMVLLTLHDPNFALKYCDTLIILDNGELSSLELKSSRKDIIEDSLKNLYGEVELIQHNGYYYMI